MPDNMLTIVLFIIDPTMVKDFLDIEAGTSHSVTVKSFMDLAIEDLDGTNQIARDVLKSSL